MTFKGTVYMYMGCVCEWQGSCILNFYVPTVHSMHIRIDKYAHNAFLLLVCIMYNTVIVPLTQLKWYNVSRDTFMGSTTQPYN